MHHKYIWAFCSFSVFIFFFFNTCYTSSNISQENAFNSYSNITNSKNDIDRIIREMADGVINKLKPGTRLAVVNVSSESKKFCDYVVEEFIIALEDKEVLSIVDRNTLHLSLHEMEISLQYSGSISEETQVSMCKMIGAQSLLSASIIDVGDVYRFRIAVFNVETMQREVTLANDVDKNNRIIALLETGEPLHYRSEKDPINAADFRRRGNKYLENKEYSGAINDYTQAINMNPQDIDAWFLRARSYVEKVHNSHFIDDLIPALNDLKEVLKLNPNYASAFNLRAEAYWIIANSEVGFYQKNQLIQRSIDDLNQAINISSNNIFLTNRSQMYYELNNYNTALNDINKAIFISPYSSNALYLRAKIFYAMNNINSAILDLENAMARDPEINYLKLIGNLRENKKWIE